MIRVRVRRQRCTGPAQWGHRFRRCSSCRSTLADWGRRVPGCLSLAPGRFRRVGAAGFSYTGIMPEGVLGVGTNGLASAFNSAMRLAKANSMRVTASGPRKASCLVCASFNSPRSAACKTGSCLGTVDFCGTPFELTEYDPGRKLPFLTAPQRVDCRRLKSYLFAEAASRSAMGT